MPFGILYNASSITYHMVDKRLCTRPSRLDRKKSILFSLPPWIGGNLFYIYYPRYEEIYPPDVSEFVFITDDTYNKRQVMSRDPIVM